MSVNKSARIVSSCSPSAFSLIPETRTDNRRLYCSRLSSNFKLVDADAKGFLESVDPLIFFFQVFF